MMLTPILVLLAIMSRLEPGAPALLETLGINGAAWVSLALIVGPSLATWPLVSRWYRRIDRTGSWPLIARTSRLLAIEQLLAGLATAGSIVWLGWLDAVRAWMGDWVLLDEVVACLPWALATAVIATQSHGLERRLRGAMLVRELDEGAEITPLHGLPGWIVLRLRETMLCTLMPGLVFLAWIEGVGSVLIALDRAWPGAFVLSDSAMLELTGAGNAVVMVGILVIALGAPVIVGRVLPTVRVRSGRLVELVATVCAARGRRPLPVRLWRPSMGQANAMVMGMVPGTRTVLVSEGLIAGLNEPMLAAVLAHEVGHVKRRHIPWMAGAAMAASLGVQAIGIATGGEGGFGIVTFVTIGVVIGLVSRRFEAQADVFAAETLETMGMDRVGACETMVDALGRVAALNRVSLTRRDYLHGSIAQRKARLRAFAVDEGIGRRVHREAGWTKVAVGASLAASVAGWLWIG